MQKESLSVRTIKKAIAKDCGLSVAVASQESAGNTKAASRIPCSSYAGENNTILLPDFEIQTLDDEIEIIPKQLGHFQILDELQAVKN